MAVPAETSAVPEASDPHRAPTGEGLRARRLADRRAELLDAAVRVIRREGDGVAMEAIATEAGISRPILYRHFGDASGLYSAVARRFNDELTARLQRTGGAGSGRALLHRQVVTFLALVAEDPNVYRFLVRRAPARDRSRALRSDVSRLVAARTADFLAGAGWERPAAVVAADLLVGGLEATADRWLDEPVGSHDEVAELVTTLAWSGFRALAHRAAATPAPGPTSDRDT
jgi:AcrR family transcriptional regulator